MSYKQIFFDLDGTLIDSKKGIFNAVHYTLDKMGIPLNARVSDLNPFIGPPLRESFINLFNFSTELAETATSIYREYYSDKGLYEYTIYEGIKESLEELYQTGILLSVVTSKAEVYAKRIIESTGLGVYFQTISGCEINGLRSTKFELIQYTLHKFKLNPSAHIIMVGDRHHDLRGAKQAGIHSAAVLYGYGPKEELLNENPNVIIKTPGNLVILKDL